MANCLRVCFSVLTLSLMTACDSSETPVAGGASGVDQRVSAEDFSSPETLLQTGSDLNDVDSFWFCTYIVDGKFADRKQVHLLDGGVAFVDGVQSDWAFEQNVLSFGDGIAVGSVAFDSRLFNADKFSAADSGGLQLSCDWSGPARLGSTLFNDESPDSFALLGEGIDTLLVTGNSANSRTSHWQCQSPVHGWERSLYLFSDGSVEFDGAGRWVESGVDSFDISSSSGTQSWTEVRIAENNAVLYDSFTANLDGELVQCDWAGAPRAIAYSD